MGDEKSDYISQLKTTMDKFSQQYRVYREEMKRVDHHQDLFNDIEKKFKALKESDVLFIQELEKQDIDKYRQNQRKVDGRIKKLVEERSEGNGR